MSPINNLRESTDIQKKQMGARSLQDQMSEKTSQTKFSKKSKSVRGARPINEKFEYVYKGREYFEEEKKLSLY